MTIELPLSSQVRRAPSYLRRTPRWYDGVARLLDIGGAFDFRPQHLSDGELLLEDREMVRRDMIAAVQELRATLGTGGEEAQ